MNHLGYITEDPNIHVCGFNDTNTMVLVQTKTGEKPFWCKLLTKYSMNDHFRVKGKKVFFKAEVFHKHK